MQTPADSLPPIFVKVKELESATTMLDEIQRQNHILWVAIALIVLLFAVAVFFIVKYIQERSRRENLINSLLLHHAQTLPKFADTINKISSDNFALSHTLYDDLQLAINDVKKGQKTNMSSIVNDSEFIKKHPYLEKLQSLSVQERLVTVLFQEGFDASQTATLMGISPNGVRAIKAHVKTKLSVESSEEIINHLEILK